jgi:hypothetical protein
MQEVGTYAMWLNVSIALPIIVIAQARPVRQSAPELAQRGAFLLVSGVSGGRGDGLELLLGLHFFGFLFVFFFFFSFVFFVAVCD